MNQLRIIFENFLQENQIKDLNFEWIHGFVSSLLVCNNKCMVENFYQYFAEEITLLTSERIEFFSNNIINLANKIEQDLHADESEVLSFLITQDSLTDWCCGFIEAHMENEKFWFTEQSQQKISELLLPIMLASELFDDMPEFQNIYQQEELYESMLIQVPEVFVELYLMFQL